MNILSLNLYFSGKNSLDVENDISNLLNEYNIDIAGFQEINIVTYNKIKNRLGNEYDSIYKGGPGGYSIFTKYKIVKNLTNKCDYGNNIIINYNGININIINLHLHEHYDGKIPFGPYIKKKYLIDDVFKIIYDTQLKHVSNMYNNSNKYNNDNNNGNDNNNNNNRSSSSNNNNNNNNHDN